MNGYEQHDGDQYRAKLFSASIEEKTADFEVDLTCAYEAEAGIKSYVRKLSFDRVTGDLTISDRLQLHAPGSVTRHFISVQKPELRDGSARYQAGAAALVLKFDPASTGATLTEKDLEAANQKTTWGCESCFRLDLTETGKQTEFALTAELVWEI